MSYHITLDTRNFNPLYVKYNFSLKKLHLYNFKQKKQFKSQLIFQHATFKRGNQSQFTSIQRTKNKKEKLGLLKELENNDVLKSIAQSNALTQQQKQILGTMYSYKLVVIQKQRSLKQKLSELTECIKSNRNKKIGEIETVLQDEVKLQLESLKKFSKSIDIFLSQTISDREKQFQRKSQILNQNQSQPFQNLQKSLSDGTIKKQGSEKSYQHNNFGLTPEKNSNETKHFEAMAPNQGYIIQLSGSSISSNSNPVFDYQIYFQNPSLNITVQQQIQNSQERVEQITQQQFVPSTRMNTQNSIGLPMDIFAYQKEPSILFMPLPFYNRSGTSEFFDWPNIKHQHYEEKQNHPKQEQKHLTEVNKQKLTSSRMKTSSCAVSGKTLKTHDGVRTVEDYQQESEISFMNDD